LIADGSFRFSELTSISIPDSVTSIGDYAFSGCSKLTSINIPNSVTSIGNNALNGCSGLTSINIPNSVTSIGDSVFSGCSGLTSIYIPDSVTSIGNNALHGCSGLTSINIPNSVTSIGDSAFWGCSGLTSINIPDSVTSIGNYAFEYCSKLTSINIPNSVTFIRYSAFDGCIELTSVSLDSNYSVGVFRSVFPSSQITDIVIGSNVTSIGDYAFSGCSGLTSINIPNSVTSIGDSAFEYCSKLTSINIPNSVTSIGDYAFHGCIELTSVSLDSDFSVGKFKSVFPSSQITDIVIGSNVTSIGDYAFDGCSELTSVNIPGSVTSIGNNAFSGCNSLQFDCDDGACYLGNENNEWYAVIKTNSSSATSITINSDTVVIACGAFKNCSELASIDIPSSVTFIGSYAFESCTKLKNVSIPDSVVSIEWDAFRGCTSLTNLTIGDGVTSIGQSAFSSFTNLEYVHIGNNVTSIEEYAFENCTSLTSIIIPNNVKTIGPYSFSSCVNLRNVSIGASTKTRSADSSNEMISIGNNAFSSCVSLTHLSIGDEVISIGDSAFSSCSNLLSVVIPKDLKSIGYNAFYGCQSLSGFYAEEGNTYYSSLDGVLFDAERHSLIQYPAAKNESSYTIPANVAAINESAFYRCNTLSAIAIPRTVALIGENAFSECENLSSIFFQGSKVDCSSMIFTSSLIDVCVSPDYKSTTTFCGAEVTSSTDTCQKYRSLFNLCDEGNFVAGEFVKERRNDVKEWESSSSGCVKKVCFDKIGKDTLLQCDDRECYQGVCNKNDGTCNYTKIEGCPPSNESDARASDRFVSLQSSNDDNGASKTDLTFVYAGVIPAGVIALLIIVLFATPLRGKIFRACRSKESESLESGRDDVLHNDEMTKELTMTMNGEVVSLTLEKSIGRGSFGTVWLAKHGDDLTLAVKEMQRQIDGDDSEFEKELDIMSELHSDYIVRVYGSLVTEKLFYIAMEYIPLGSLSSAYKEYMLSPFMRCRLMLDVARGMEYLHDHGIIHRDLKPGNVLVSSLDPESEVLCKITDFGESRQGLEDTETMTMTCGIGSPYYMAPEMLRGDKKYTRAVDVFSFSILCVEVWNEKLPYSETQFQTPYAFMTSVLNGNRPEIVDGCPKGLTKLITKCWATERQERPSFTVIVEKLERIVKSVAKDKEDDVKPRGSIETKGVNGETQTEKPEDTRGKKPNGKEGKKTKAKSRKVSSDNVVFAESYVGVVPPSENTMEDEEKEHHHKSAKDDQFDETFVVPLDDFGTHHPEESVVSDTRSDGETQAEKPEDARGKKLSHKKSNGKEGKKAKAESHKISSDNVVFAESYVGVVASSEDTVKKEKKKMKKSHHKGSKGDHQFDETVVVPLDDFITY